ncbi:hypothetical protein Tco_0512036 [Tanacetum coccineum]
MAALKFDSSHNMVADKPTKSDGFEQIMDFLNAHPIKYALTIQALVDKKKVIITETSIKSDLQLEDAEGEGSEIPIGSHHTPTTTQPSTSKPQKKQSRRKQRKDTEDPELSGPTEPVTDDTENVAILDLEKTKTSQAVEITKLKEKGRKIDEIDQDAKAILVDETQGRYSDNLIFDTGVLDNEQDMAEKEDDMAEKDVSTADPVTTAGEVVTTANVVVSTAEVTTNSTTTTTIDELTLAQTLIEIKAAKPKARGVIVQEPSEFTTTTSPSQPSQLPQAKDKGKAKMVEPEKPLKKKDQIMFDKEVAQKLQAQLDAELEEEEKLARQREEDANIAEWDNVQAMMDADYELAARLQAEEQGELTIEEKSRLFVELMNKRKKHFARLRAEEQRRKPPTKAQKRNTMSTYLKNMAGYKHNQLKTKSFEDIQMLFDKEIKRVNTFVDMDTELVKGSETRTKRSSKSAGEELKSKNLKKQKLDENVEAEVDDDQEEAEMKKHMEIVPDNEVAIDAIPLATKPPIIVDWKIIKEGKMGYIQIKRADGSSKRPEEAYERVLWGDLKVMFEPDVESKVWRNLQGYKVTVWKLFLSRGVHFVRFQNLHIFMLVEKRYPLTPATITEMLNKKLQADHWNEMCYQLLKLMTKQLKNPGSGI